MGQCFAVGIQRREPSVRRSSGVHVIEYFKYGIRHEDTDSIEVVGDFFLPNTGKNKRIFSFVHAGDISFEALPADEILARNDFYTAFLEKSYAASVGGRFDRREGRLHGLPPSNIGPVDLRDADDYRATLSRRDADGGSGAPFTLYDVEIPGHTFGFVRVRGTIEGETLNRLTKGKTQFDIYGGEVLLDRIRTEFIPQVSSGDTIAEGRGRDDYRAVFDDFAENSYVEPVRYDIVLRSASGTRVVKTQRLSRDLAFGSEGGTLRGEKIYWYWSQSALFYVSSYPNGLRVGVELEACGSVRRWFAERWRSR